MTPLNNLPDYSELGVCDGPLDRLADPVDVPGTRPGKDGSPAGGSLSTRLPRFAPPSRGSSRVEAAEAILARVSDGPRRAAGRGIVEGGCEQGARMTTPPRRGSPARSSSAGWPRPEPVTLLVVPGGPGLGQPLRA